MPFAPLTGNARYFLNQRWGDVPTGDLINAMGRTGDGVLFANVEIGTGSGLSVPVSILVTDLHGDPAADAVLFVETRADGGPRRGSVAGTFSAGARGDLLNQGSGWARLRADKAGRIECNYAIEDLAGYRLAVRGAPSGADLPSLLPGFAKAARADDDFRSIEDVVMDGGPVSILRWGTVANLSGGTTRSYVASWGFDGADPRCGLLMRLYDAPNRVECVAWRASDTTATSLAATEPGAMSSEPAKLRMAAVEASPTAGIYSGFWGPNGNSYQGGSALTGGAAVGTAGKVYLGSRDDGGASQGSAGDAAIVFLGARINSFQMAEIGAMGVDGIAWAANNYPCLCWPVPILGTEDGEEVVNMVDLTGNFTFERVGGVDRATGWGGA